MKKVILALLLLFLPLSMADAYQHEPSGFGGLYWGMPVTQVKQRYRTTFFKYGSQGIDMYMVTIPDASGELGLRGMYSTVCSFQYNRLIMITIPIFRTRTTVDKDYEEELGFLTNLCGTPRTAPNGMKIWNGPVTCMGLMKRLEFVEIDLMDTRFVVKTVRLKDVMRKGESESVIDVFKNQMDANLVYVDAVDRFLGKLAGVADPEQKRKIIGAEFIRVFEEEARKLEGIEFLAQGTIYPDIVESGTKTAKVVKSHHNVGGLPEDLNFTLVEPLRQLFKDEVRACGLELGLPHSMVYRQPFPGPGLGVRCLGAITRERLEAVRESDAILREEFANAGLDKTVWQYFTIVPDFKSVGVRDNARCFDYPVIIRAVNTVDAMTASIERIDYDVLQKITDRILKEVKNVNRVCYDLSPKPTATIEWE